MGSATPTYEIPSEFRSKLTLVAPLDTRTDSEILTGLEHFQPVTTEKNIWAFWHSGITNLPAWCKRNVVDWHRINGPSWTIRILDSNPASPNFFLNYAPKDMFPEVVANGAMTGSHKSQHTADFVRTAVIYLHGGVFMDVGCLLIRRMDRICWDKLADESTPWRVGAALLNAAAISNAFVAARKGDRFIKSWHDLFVHNWQGKTESTGTVIDNPLMAKSFAYLATGSRDHLEQLGWDFKDLGASIEYVGQILAWIRVCHLDKTDDEGFNCAQHYLKNILFWDALHEHWEAEITAHRQGPHPWIMDVLATRTDIDPNSEQYKTAYDLTWKLLTSASLQKVTSARDLTITPHLGVLWEMPENKGKDCAPGTFAELLRWGSVHFEQTRKEIGYVDAEPLADLEDKGLFEA